MPESKEKYCRNCHYPLPPQSNFCGDCGQKYTTGRVSIRQLLEEFIGNYFNLDSKLLISPLHLLQPGRLTNEYFKGRHQRYIKPLRLFLYATLLHFALIALLTSDMDFKIGDGMIEQGHKVEGQQEVLAVLDSLHQNHRDSFPEQIDPPVLDSITKKLHHKYQQLDSIPVEFSFGNNDSLKTKISTKDLMLLSPDDLTEKYGVKGFWGQLIFKQGIKLIKDGETFWFFLIGKFSWMTFLLMPIFAFLLMLFYIRHKKYYYVEHLIFTFHFHSFVFLFYSALFLLYYYDIITGYWLLLVLPLVFFYLYKAMRKVYQQGRLKTFIKLNGLLFLYFVTFSVIFVLTIVLSAAIF